jgi:hypothetical protein
MIVLARDEAKPETFCAGLPVQAPKQKREPYECRAPVLILDVRLSSHFDFLLFLSVPLSVISSLSTAEIASPSFSSGRGEQLETAGLSYFLRAVGSAHVLFKFEDD